MLYFPDIAEQISRSPPKLMNLQSFKNTYIGLTYTEIEIDCNNIWLFSVIHEVDLL